MIGRSFRNLFDALSCRCCSIAQQCSARLPIHILKYWTELSGMLIFGIGVLACNLAHRRSVVVLNMLFKIKSNRMHHLSGALPLPYVPARITRDALAIQRHSFAPARCGTSQ